MRETTTTDIERLNVIILVLGSIASMVVMRNFIYVFSFGVASAVMTLNFRFLRKIMEAFFAGSKINKKELLIKLPVKFFGLGGLVAVIMIWGNVNLLFFLIGLSTVVISILASQIITVFMPEGRRKHNGA